MKRDKQTYQQRIGELGEGLAADYLRSEGFNLLERNYHSRYGEIDLVAEKDHCIVFVEVKTRTSQTFGLPEESVTPEKLARIFDTALFWMQEHPDKPDDWRVDVISILLNQNLETQDIQHFISVN
jgi:putative endonuclease